MSNSFSKQRLIIGQLATDIYRCGPASGTTHGDSKHAVLFLHGWRSNGLVWKDAMAKLSEDGFTSYAPDLPGFGGSEAPREENGWSVDDYAEYIDGLLKKLEVGPVVLVGHSFGGRVGIALAAKMPECISRLVLVDAAGVREVTYGAQLKGFIATLAKPFFKPSFMQGLRKSIYRQLGAEDYLATLVLTKTFVRVINEDLTPILALIKQPTLILWGDRDTDTPVSYARTMKEKIKNSSLEIFENAGHYSFLDQSARFIHSLANFLNNSLNA